MRAKLKFNVIIIIIIIYLFIYLPLTKNVLHSFRQSQLKSTKNRKTIYLCKSVNIIFIYILTFY